MANTIGGEKKQAGNSTPATPQYRETAKADRYSDRKHKADVGTPSKSGRTTDAAKAVHGQFANPGEANNDGRAARKSNTNHTDPNVGGYPQRKPVKK